MFEVIKELAAQVYSFQISHNNHKLCYETVADHLQTLEDLGNPAQFVSEDDRQLCIENDDMWEIYWHPRTPVASGCIFGHTLENCLNYLTKETE